MEENSDGKRGRRGRKEENEREGGLEECKGEKESEGDFVSRFTKRLFMTCRLGQHFKAGMMAGVLTTVIMAPGERIKCLMQVCVRG